MYVHTTTTSSPQVSQLDVMRVALQSLEQNHIRYSVYDTVRVEPSNISFADAVAFAKRGNFDAYLAVGGGSVMVRGTFLHVVHHIEHVAGHVQSGQPVCHVP